MLTVSALEYLNVSGLDLADPLLVGAVDFEEVFVAFALRLVVETGWLVLVSAIALRFGGILDFMLIERGMVVDINERGGGVIPTVVYRRHLMIFHTRHRDASSSSRAFRTFLSFCTYLYSQRRIFNGITVDFIPY
jgi:hypothetical protein